MRHAAERSALALIVAFVSLTSTAAEPHNRVDVLGCRAVEGESSISLMAVDQNGRPAESLYVDALSKKHSREQSVRTDADGRGKIWVGREWSYELQAYGADYSIVASKPIRVPLGCELQVRIRVVRPAVRPRVIL
jgi:hypothetical protein